MTPDIVFDGGSFKDPAGRVFFHDGAVFRTLSEDARERFEALVACGLYDDLLNRGLMVKTKLRRTADLGLPVDTLGASVLEHERLPFISYPYEWSFDMLRDAARATLVIIELALEQGHTLKDATSFNIQFREAKPVLIDVLSLEPYREGEPWVGYSQFCSSFLYPLMLSAYKGVDFQPVLRGMLGTIPVEYMSGLLGLADLRRPGVLAHVKAPARLQRSFEKTDIEVSERFAEIRYSKTNIVSLLGRLARTIDRMQYRSEQSTWTGYSVDNTYTAEAAREKTDFIQQAMGERQPARVCDLGANVGVYSELAAQAGAHVLAMDSDAATVNALYAAQKVGKRSPRIQPLVVDLANPSPSMGWRLMERRSLAERAEADFFIAVALVHHLVISSNIPVAQFVEYLRAVAPAGVTEFVTKDDPMVEQLLRRREDVFADYELATFTAELEKHFAIVRTHQSDNGTRFLFAVAER